MGDGVVGIALTQGKIAIIDADDLPIVKQYTWRLCNGYATTSVQRRKNVLMHKMITGFALTDHEDGDGLNNRRSNLRPATTQQNVFNAGKRRNNKTGYKGVCFHGKYAGRFLAYIKFNYKTKNLGVFSSAEDAARAYDKAAIELHGEFARLNFPEEHRIGR